MLVKLFPRAGRRYLSLPLFGPVMDDFDDWLLEQGYARSSRRRLLLPNVAHVDQQLRRRGVEHIKNLTPLALQRCWNLLHRRFPAKAAAVHVMERFLRGRKLLPPPPAPDSSALQLQVAAYADHLRQVRGSSPSTVQSHIRTATQFLTFLQVDKTPSVLARVDVSHVERFVRKEGKGVSRGTLQHTIAALRGLLRFLAVSGKVTPGLETQIDTPLLYREEQLPRALPWETVRSFLQSIPRATPMGRRDHAMFFLIATYGLRVSEVVALTLDDLAWRSAQIRISQMKIRGAIILPLIDEVAAVLADYLRHVQRPTGLRHLFFRVRAPFGPLKRAAVSKAFQGWSRRSGLNIPFQGAHCLRHSYAVHLLRHGTSLKTIGDILGHRSPESTAHYLRLATEDLREVGLSVPRPNFQMEVRA
jgi:site-specific recombinase XerD